MDELIRLKELLLKERDEDLKQYNDAFRGNNVDHRKKNGVTWYPVSIVHTEIGLGEYLVIDVERTTDFDQQHQFSNGRNVMLFSNQYADEKPVNGTIRTVNRQGMKISLMTDELPDWCYDGKLGINLSFDDLTYREMEAALDRVIDAQGNRLAAMRDIIYGVRKPTFHQQKEVYANSALNDSQVEAVNKILSADDLALVHGPPGTGKTTTLLHAITEVLKTEKQVLFCSGSNTAVDLLTEKLHRAGINVLRLGNPVRISDDVISNTLDVRITTHESSSILKNHHKRAEEFFRMAGKYKRILGREEREQRQLLYQEAKKLIREARDLEDYILKDLLEQAQVIACTPVVSSGRMLRGINFNTLFFDEAAQALEPMCWIPAAKCNRMILAGDHLQLPPTVKSDAAGLKKTLFEKAMQVENASVMLDVQYRMNEHIMQFSNKMLYDEQLKAHPFNAHQVLFADEIFPLLNTAVTFVDTAGCGFEEKVNPSSRSSFNPEEAQLAVNHLYLLLDQYYTDAKQSAFLSVGIISPYKEQVELISELLTAQSFTQWPVRISPKTIDGFQGQERDVIYISLVRSNDEKEIGFLNDIRRMNVALTRAKKKLVVIGDSATLSNHPFYKSFVEYAESINAYTSAWEFI